MSIFYDPQKKKPQPWVFVAFILIPILVITIWFVIGQQAVEKKRLDHPEVKEDIFDRF